MAQPLSLHNDAAPNGGIVAITADDNPPKLTITYMKGKNQHKFELTVSKGDAGKIKDLIDLEKA